MAGLTDERIRFYLRHHEQIEAWAALRSEAATAVDDLLATLVDDVDSIAEELGVLVKVVVDGASYPRFMFHHERWRMDPEAPEASIAFEWNRGKTLLLDTAAPYLGARFDVGTDDMRRRRDRFCDLTKTVRVKRGESAGLWWPCFQRLSADGPFWEDFDAYRDKALTAIRSAWDAYSEPMTQVLSEPLEGAD